MKIDILFVRSTTSYIIPGTRYRAPDTWYQFTSYPQVCIPAIIVPAMRYRYVLFLITSLILVCLVGSDRGSTAEHRILVLCCGMNIFMNSDLSSLTDNIYGVSIH